MQPRTIRRTIVTRVESHLLRIALLLGVTLPIGHPLQARESQQGNGTVTLNIPIETGATALPVLRIGSPTRRLATNSGERIQFPVHLTRATDQPVILDYHTTNRTAISGRDYVATSGRITLAPGVIESMVEVELLPGEDPGRDLWFQLIGAAPRFFPPRVIQPAVSGVGTLQTHAPTEGISGFQWNSLPTHAAPGASIQVSIQALDPRLKPTPAAGSRVKISAHPGSGRPHPVVLSTVNVRYREVLIHSTVDHEVSLEGWSLHLYDEQSWPHPGVTWIGGPTNILQPFHFLTIQAATAGSVLTSLRWAPGDSGLGLNRPVAALLQDPAGNAVDFFSIGGARSIDMKYPIRLIPEEWPGFENGNRPQPWSGGSAIHSISQSLHVFVREGAMTRGSANEWLLCPLPSIPTNSLAHNLQLPWHQSSAEPLALGEVELNNDGSWQGTLTLPTVTGPWILMAEAENGRRTFSPVIGIGPAGDLGIVRFDISPIWERQSFYPGRWSMTVSNGSPTLATGVVARIRHGIIRGRTEHPSWATKTNATLLRVEVDPLHGPHVEARLGDLAPGETVDLGGLFVGYHTGITPVPFSAGITAQSGDMDAADNFRSSVVQSTSTSTLSVTDAVWSGEGGSNSLKGDQPLILVGDVSFTTRWGRPAFRLGQTNSWIELPGDLGPAWTTQTNGHLEFLFRLSQEDRRTEPMTLVSRDDPSNPALSYRLDFEAGILLAYVGDVRMGGRVGNHVGTWDQPIDFRDGLWHSVRLSQFIGSVPDQYRFGVWVDGNHLWSWDVTMNYPLAGNSLPIRIGGGPDRASLQCDVDEIWTSTRFNIQGGLHRFFPKAHINLTAESSQPFIGLDSATAGRPFTLNFNFSNAGPFTSEPVVARISKPTNWTLLSATYPGGGPMFESWVGVHAELGALAPDQETRLSLTYIAPAGSNNLFVQASLPAFDSVSPALTIPILIDADSDQDGLSDSWETELGLSSEDPTDVRLDLDGDGIDALGEWEAGTDPDDSASVLAIRWTVEPGGTWNLRIDSQVGRTYYLERSPELGLGNPWEAAGEFSGTGGTLELGILKPESDTSRLYRVRVRRNR